MDRHHPLPHARRVRRARGSSCAGRVETRSRAPRPHRSPGRRTRPTAGAVVAAPCHRHQASMRAFSSAERVCAAPEVIRLRVRDRSVPCGHKLIHPRPLVPASPRSPAHRRQSYVDSRRRSRRHGKDEEGDTIVRRALCKSALPRCSDAHLDATSSCASTPATSSSRNKAASVI